MILHDGMLPQMTRKGSARTRARRRMCRPADYSREGSSSSRTEAHAAGVVADGYRGLQCCLEGLLGKTGGPSSGTRISARVVQGGA